jgi:MOSC domain-containing protein YiiM
VLVSLARIVSINVGLPRQVPWGDATVRTSIFKSPVTGPVRVGRTNLDGDGQADLAVHGGARKAVYAYPTEHYAYWRDELPGVDLPWGAFGENFSTRGLLEDAVRVGDLFAIGSARFVVTQPRRPCFKLGIRLGQPDMVKRFQESGRSGFYLAVTQEGNVAAGDGIALIEQADTALTIADMVLGKRTPEGGVGG